LKFILIIMIKTYYQNIIDKNKNNNKFYL